MSTAAGFSISWLKLTGPGLEPAQIDFEPGLNVIWGASETGKSFIFACIDFMLGRSDPPKQIAELRGYTSAWLALTVREGNKQLVLERGLKGGDFHLYLAEGEDWSISNSETLHAKHSPTRTDTISHLLLLATGVQGAIILEGKTKGKTRQISFRDVAHMTMISEERIIAERTPVYPTGQDTRKTEEMATFTYLISGNDWSGVIAAPDINQQKANWRGKNELFEQLIEELKKEIGESPPLLKEIANQIATCDARIVEVTSKIEESNKILEEQMRTRKSAWHGAHQAQSRLTVVEQLRDRFEQLLKHYKSDMDRLRFISEGDFFLAQLGAPHCPFCGELLEDHSAKQLQEEAAKGSIQEAAAEETKKIVANIRDLEKTMSALSDEQNQLDNTIVQRQDEIVTAEEIIRNELEPIQVSDKKELAEIVETRSNLLSKQAVLERLELLTNRHKALGKEPKQKRGKTQISKPSPNPEPAHLRQLADEIATILKEWRYLESGVVEFDTKMDLVVAGEPRHNRGKGIRAVLHSAFTIGIMKHCERQNLCHTGMILLDSPLTSYKEKDYQDVNEDIQIGFFESLLKLPQHQQVIVFENKEPPQSIMPKLRHTHYSGSPGVNQARFIPARNEMPPSDSSGAGDGDGKGGGTC